VERGVALVTGASAGLGAAFARVLAAIGLDLVLVARRRERLEALAAEIQGAHGARVDIQVADLSCDDDIQAVAARIAELENLDILVNNAGFGTLGRFHAVDVDIQDRMNRLHVLATTRLTHAALRGMVARRHGAIINVSSVSGYAPAPGNAVYAATKAWMTAFTETLYMELKGARSPVRVQALCPGFTYSEFHDVMGVDRARIPAGWWMSPEAVVAESMRGLRDDRPVVIPGRGYKLLVALLRFVPRSLYYLGAAEYSRRAGRELDRPRPYTTIRE
jgi:short-subunit dehydrogenase